jgi:hypothetical protein
VTEVTGSQEWRGRESHYDNAGNALTTFDGTYTYDAASRPVTFTSNQTWKVYPDWPLNPPDGPSLETQNTFDGSGQIAKHVNHTRTDQSIDYGDGNFYYSLGEATTTTYYVHSTVRRDTCGRRE